VQGFLLLLEPSITVHSRKKDTETVKQAAISAVNQYTDISGRDVTVDVEGSLNNDLYVSLSVPSGSINSRDIAVESALEVLR
jgi:V-type H+-transporting ATPase subunit E